MYSKIKNCIILDGPWWLIKNIGNSIKISILAQKMRDKMLIIIGICLILKAIFMIALKFNFRIFKPL